MIRARTWVALSAALVACDGAQPTAVGNDARPSCAGYAEGTYQCAPQQQCCGGVWRVITDGPCFARDGGSSTTDCSGGAHRPGCACAAEGVTECRLGDDSLRCVDGVWTALADVACCAP